MIILNISFLFLSFPIRPLDSNFENKIVISKCYYEYIRSMSFNSHVVINKSEDNETLNEKMLHGLFGIS